MTHHMIRHGDEQIKEQPSTVFHLVLHCAAPLERLSATNDEGEVMSPQFRVRVWRINVGIAGARENRTTSDAGLQALLSQGKTLELWQGVSLGCTLDNR